MKKSTDTMGIIHACQWKLELCGHRNEDASITRNKT